MFYVAKTLQAFGMGILTIALLMGLQTGDTRTEVGMLIVGAIVFAGGVSLEKRRKT